jgi:Tol biopolymer transport system component
MVSFTEAQKVEKVVVQSGKIFICPQESPDGKTLAFTQEGYKGIFLLKENNEISELTSDIASGFAFRWLKDASGIIARSARYIDIKRENSVVVYSTIGLNTLQLSGFSGRMTILPGVSTNGDIYFVENSELKTYNTYNKNTVAKSPNGIAAYIENDKISVVSENFPKRVIEPVKGERCINASLSPDGTKITFEIMGGNLYSINSDGSGLVDLGRGYRGSWAPDSKKIAYMVTEDDGRSITKSDIFVINSDGTAKIQVTNTNDVLEMNPSFSTNGRFIYFDNIADGAIYRISTEGLK